MNQVQVTQAVLSLAILTNFAGCDLEDADVLEDELDTETVDTSAQALGEDSCYYETDRTTSCNLGAVGTFCTSPQSVSGYGFGGFEDDAPPAGYACIGQWSNSWTGQAAQAMGVEHSPVWAGTPLNTQSLCQSARVFVAAYGRTQGGLAFKVGEKTTNGVWSNGTCSFPNAGLTQSLVCGSQCERYINTTVRAWRATFPVGTPENVRARVTRTF